jgi:hypothetical protein
MNRRTVAALIVGWLLGIVTAFAIPTLLYERRSMVASPQLGDAFSSGWYVVRTDGPGNTVYTLERPRVRLP